MLKGKRLLCPVLCALLIHALIPGSTLAEISDSASWAATLARSYRITPNITYLTAMARWWNTVLLPALPVAFGALSTLLQSNFFFDGIGDKGGRIAFGGCVGWFAGFIYQALKRAFKQKMGIDINPGGDTEDE